MIVDDRLFTHYIFSAVFIKLRKFLITDGVHTENTEGNGGPQADFVGERKLSRIDRELKEMGPQADDGGERKLKRINRELKENNFVP